MPSLFYDDIKKLMKSLRNSGFDLEYVEKFLDEFDSFCMEQYPSFSILSQEIAEEWIHSYTTTSRQQMDKRVRTMKRLGGYQRTLGKEAYIPRYKISYPKPELPSLFSNEQLIEFFEILDGLNPSKRSPNRELIFPIMFRLIYCCGLRSSEACRLKVSDINFEKSKLTILQSKGHKDREIFMSDEISKLCLRFHNYYSSILPNREYFFQGTLENGRFKNTYVCGIFNTVLKQTSFYSQTTKKPTTHGLRHLFAVNSMKKCLESGEDFNNWIKYLSKYMGHSTCNETLYYLHMLADLLPMYKQKLAELVEGFGVEYVEE